MLILGCGLFAPAPCHGRFDQGTWAFDLGDLGYLDVGCLIWGCGLLDMGCLIWGCTLFHLGMRGVWPWNVGCLILECGLFDLGVSAVWYWDVGCLILGCQLFDLGDVGCLIKGTWAVWLRGCGLFDQGTWASFFLQAFWGGRGDVKQNHSTWWQLITNRKINQLKKEMKKRKLKHFNINRKLRTSPIGWKKSIDLQGFIFVHCGSILYWWQSWCVLLFVCEQKKNTALHYAAASGLKECVEVCPFWLSKAYNLVQILVLLTKIFMWKNLCVYAAVCVCVCLSVCICVCMK